VLVLALGGTAAFATVGAQAAVPAPAVLLIFTPSVELKHAAGAYAAATTGALLEQGDWVRTGAKGRAAIELPDGSVTKLDVNTELQLTTAELGSDGRLARVQVDQTAGRTLTKVQHLLAGSTYNVHGHAASVEVRGTQFEITIAAAGTALVQLFEGKLHVSGTNAADLGAGQQTAVAPNGTVGAPAPLQEDPNDIFTLERRAAGAQTGNLGSVQVDENSAGPGQAVQARPYGHPGGDLSAVLAYPGSLMRLDLSGPNGFHASQAVAPPIKITVPNAPPGVYTATATALDVPAAGENLVLSLGNNLACKPGTVEQGGARRYALAAADVAAQLQKAGISGATVSVQGTSPTGVTVSADGSLKGARLSFAAVALAAPPNLVVVPTRVSAAGFPVAATRLAGIVGVNLRSIPVGFQLDRVYTCPGVMVLEGRD